MTFATQATERNSQIARSSVANDVPGEPSLEPQETLLSQLRKNAPGAAPSQQSPSAPEKLKRIELRATQEFLDVLDELAKKENLSRADIIRKGVALYARARIEASKGRLLGVISLKDGQIHTEEVFHV
ncbi:MAG: ribbon-helix-helix protein, CopG family [Synechococcaceae cyanobacterium]